jgi:hypothetical protein
MNQPLVMRNEETKLIQVNFDPQLTAVLREVKYLDGREEQEIPESAKAMFAKNDTFWRFVTNLDLTVHVNITIGLNQTYKFSDECIHDYLYICIDGYHSNTLKSCCYLLTFLKIKMQPIFKIKQMKIMTFAPNTMKKSIIYIIHIKHVLYNKVRNTILEVEFPLVEGQLQEIDVQLEQAEKSLNWESDGKVLL